MTREQAQLLVSECLEKAAERLNANGWYLKIDLIERVVTAPSMTEPTLLKFEGEVFSCEGCKGHLFWRLINDPLRFKCSNCRCIYRAERDESGDNKLLVDPPPPINNRASLSGDLCDDCGNPMMQTGSCKTCTSCGKTGGCG